MDVSLPANYRSNPNDQPSDKQSQQAIPAPKTVKWDQNESPSKDSVQPLSQNQNSFVDKEFEPAQRIKIDDVMSNDSKLKRDSKRDLQSSKADTNRESSKAIKRMEELLTFDSPSKVQPSERLAKLKPKSLNRKEF